MLGRRECKAWLVSKEGSRQGRECVDVRVLDASRCDLNPQSRSFFSLESDTGAVGEKSRVSDNRYTLQKNVRFC